MKFAKLNIKKEGDRIIMENNTDKSIYLQIIDVNHLHEEEIKPGDRIYIRERKT